MNVQNITGSQYVEHTDRQQRRKPIDGGESSDTMIGGDGSDIYFVGTVGDIVTETNADLATGGMILWSSPDWLG